MATEDGVVVGIYEGDELTAEGLKLNDISGGSLLKKWKITGKSTKAGECATFVCLSDELPRVAVVGLGKKSVNEDIIRSNIRLAAGAGVKALQAIGANNIGIDNSFGNLQVTAEGAYMALYRYRGKRPEKESNTTVYSFPKTDQEEKDWEYGRIVAQAQNWARDLAETPSNLMTPSLFVEEVTSKFNSLSNENVKVVAYDKEWMQSQKMEMLLSVTSGSFQAPKFLRIDYNTKSCDCERLVYVGKGITFDTGGISIKGASGMKAMKADMMGAATVVAAAFAIAQLQFPINLSVITPLMDNMPDGNATKPGDVFTASNGLTVEVDNTDAEGRLILGDALHFAHTLNPHTIVDVATLTGAIDVALGFVCAGAFTPSDALWDELLDSSRLTSEKMWRMPLFEEYKKQLESNVADLANITPTRSAGSCTAAVFLKEFVTLERWLHLDIAGVMTNDHAPSAIESKGMSGKPVRTLIELAKVAGLKTTSPAPVLGGGKKNNNNAYSAPSPYSAPSFASQPTQAPQAENPQQEC